MTEKLLIGMLILNADKIINFKYIISTLLKLRDYCSQMVGCWTVYQKVLVMNGCDLKQETLTPLAPF